MAHNVKVSARTKAMKAAGEDAVSKTVQFPNSISEIKEGIGPWKTLKEMFDDAKAHAIVKIQSEMRKALEANGSVDSDDSDNEENDDFVEA